MKKLIRLPRWGRWLTRIVFTPLGMILGYMGADSLIIQYNLLSSTSVFYIPICLGGAIVGGLILLFAGPFVCRLVYSSVNQESHIYKKYSPAEIVSAFIGLTCGLFIAFLVTNLYNFIPEAYNILTITLSIVTYIGLGVTGMILGHSYLSGIISPNSTTTVLTPKLLDSSILIDGRIVDIAKTGFICGPFVIPNFIINEIKNVADSPDAVKRNRGRRGLDVIKTLQNDKSLSVVIDESVLDGDNEAKIIALAKELKGEIVTVNYNLTKLADVKNVKTLNINDLSNAIKPVALPGEKLTVEIIKQGKDKAQGVAFLPDGTMIVVENGGDNIGETKDVSVATSLQTSTGRIIFARIEE
ncbi:MAG TPA: hypothetical protein P5087_03145 [Eubacteriales bacterium]|nr:hypothetical protein [Eubacteriales bacterium]